MKGLIIIKKKIHNVIFSQYSIGLKKYLTENKRGISSNYNVINNNNMNLYYK